MPDHTPRDKTRPSTHIVHAMTIDVEDYFHVAAFDKVVAPESWHTFPSRVEHNTYQLLDLFADRGVNATFFVLGWVAEKFPNIVREIASRGHEIASHGWSHQLVFQQTPEVFRQETHRSKSLIEDQAQKPVTGYRAASYSITHQSLWALETLAELGFTWDSSIFPIHHDRYGIPGSPEHPYRIQLANGAILDELPLTTAKVFGYPIPAAGGGYFRQFPYPLFRWLFDRASQNQSRPVIFYLHPWEIDPDQPRIPGAGFKSNFRHYTNLHRCWQRLEKLLDDFTFGTITDSLSSFDINDQIDLNNI